MRKLLVLLLLALPFTSAATPPTGTPVPATPLTQPSFLAKPKLVLVVVVDQLRADFLTRFQSRFLPARQGDGSVGGYNYLMSEGAYFPFAQYDVLQCMTGPGHSMIMSGSYPYQTGISLNGWYDTQTGKRVYCSEDKETTLVGAGLEDKSGSSPRKFRGTTVGDEIKNAGFPTRSFSVALKDRAAIFLGGYRADLALWLDPASLQWTTSTFYLPQKKLPEWVTGLNQELATRKGKPYVWTPSGKPTGLTLPPLEFKRETTVGTKDSLNYPLGLEITTQAVERALVANGLGKGKSTDILTVSYSSHDYLGHLIGPNTLEMEEMTVQEDRLLSHLFNTVRKNVPGGLRDVVIVLTGDHGIPTDSRWLAQQRIPAAAVDTEKLNARLEEALAKKFGKPEGGKWLPAYFDFNYYLAPAAIAASGASRQAVEEELKALLRKEEWVAFAFSRTDYENRKLPPAMFERQILKSYVPGRNGDVLVIPRIYYTDHEGPFTHITSYAYDRTVPLVLAGQRIRKGVYATPADAVDIAPTLSFLLGILPPATSEGRVLAEILTSTAATPKGR